MKKEEYQQALVEELKQLQKEEQEDEAMEQMENQQNWQELYGNPEPEEKQNAHSFLHKAAFGDEESTLRTTFLHEGELGKGLFTVRFLLDMEDIVKFYLDSLVEKNGATYNRVAKYFREKITNVSSSGMSNRGFSMNLNVTRKMDSTRTREKYNIDNLKGGK